MGQKITLFVEDEEKRLDKFVARKLASSASRVRVKELIEAGMVTVDGKAERTASRPLAKGQTVVVDYAPSTKQSSVTPEHRMLCVAYEDEDVLVVDKQNNVIVHPGAGNKDHTLANALAGYLNERIGPKAGLVHRIDKQTTGLLLVAKNERAMLFLTDQMKQRKIKRTYVAIVKGVIGPSSGTINAPIGRSPTNRLKMAVTAYNSKEAVTHFKVIKRGVNWTALECELQTGRTHQIRVHLSYIKHPVIGDVTYGGQPLPDDFGQLLHAAKLSFIHPVTKKTVAVFSPLPEEFASYLPQEQ